MIATARERLADIELLPLDDGPPTITFGVILTGDAFVNSRAERRRLAAEFSAQAVEMEGAAVAQVADQLGVPFLVVRALSDLAGENAPSPDVFAHFLEVASANSASVVRHLRRCLDAHPDRLRHGHRRLARVALRDRLAGGRAGGGHLHGRQCRRATGGGQYARRARARRPNRCPGRPRSGRAARPAAGDRARDTRPARYRLRRASATDGRDQPDPFGRPHHRGSALGTR